MVEASGVESHVQDVGDVVDAHHGVLQGVLHELVYLIVYARAGLELAELTLAREFVAKRFLGCRGCKVVEVGNRLVHGRPRDAADTLGKRVLAHILRGPLGEIAIVRRAAPLARLVVYPECSVGSVAGAQHSRVAIGCHRIDHASALGCNLQFVAQRGDLQVMRRGGIFGLLTGKFLVVHAENGLQRLAVEPALAHNSVYIRTCATKQACHGRCAVWRIERVLGLRIGATLLHQTCETLAAVKGREGVHVIGAKLVDDNVHNKARHIGRRLCLGRHDGYEHHQRTQPIPLRPFCIHHIYLLAFKSTTFATRLSYLRTQRRNFPPFAAQEITQRTKPQNKCQRYNYLSEFLRKQGRNKYKEC